MHDMLIRMQNFSPSCEYCEVRPWPGVATTLAWAGEATKTKTASPTNGGIQLHASATSGLSGLPGEGDVQCPAVECSGSLSQ